ncbi:hypothetical protein QTI66_00175 [Variovorax sp. J22R133]|uniref:hypothetical protein n=1 Tax=Variovorax brevis TaxID=3053503 RepID=UPI002577B75F|nr:hypothetical protein [Variovorax sp. J22R133]MDM0110543.1 hypothetical protein [Variovorax sp. J22R133]
MSQTADDAARNSFGRAVALQPTKVRSPRSGPANSQWKVAERGRNRSTLPTRYYGVLVDNSDSNAVIQNVASIPDRWIGMDGSTDDVFQAAIVPNPDFPDSRRIELSVTDPDASSLMSFLQTGDLDAALAVAKPAMNFVEQGAENAYAAVAAAYALVFAPSGSGNEGWERWVLELSAKRQDIPDGKILEATLLLQRSVPQMILGTRRFPPPSTQERINYAWDCVMEALRRGPPVFRLGLGLLESNIRIIRDSEIESNTVDRNSVMAAARITSWFRARVDPYQPLCVFDVT